MENLVTYSVLVKYVDSLGRERRYSRRFDDYLTALAFFYDKFDAAKYACDIYFYRLFKKETTTHCEIIKNVFVG